MEKTEQETMETKRVIEVVGGIIRRGEKYLLGKRPEGKSLGGHWEFIGGKIESGETPEEALARECREELALDIDGALLLGGRGGHILAGTPHQEQCPHQKTV